MTNELQDRLYEHAKKFRWVLTQPSTVTLRAIRRIELYLEASGRTSFKFPDNWCDFTSFALASHIARYIEEAAEITIVTGNNPDKLAGHFWLRLDDFDVDITADQFGAEPIIACRMSPWHAASYSQIKTLPFLSRPLLSTRFELLLTALECSIDNQLQDWLTCRAILRGATLSESEIVDSNVPTLLREWSSHGVTDTERSGIPVNVFHTLPPPAGNRKNK